jgi:hypothetical protein
MNAAEGGETTWGVKKKKTDLSLPSLDGVTFSIGLLGRVRSELGGQNEEEVDVRGDT